MIIVLANWLYIAITSFVTGFAVLSFFSAIFGINKYRKMTAYVLGGLAFNTVYAQAYSLFGGVGLGANAGLIFLCLIFSFILRQPIREYLTDYRNGLRGRYGILSAWGIVIILFSYGTSRGYLHYDTSLYHAQSIRWIEEYGVVPGLASLQLRYGYNSSAFAMTALYSFRDFVGQSLHTTAGFFALVGAIQVVDVYRVFADKKVRHSDFIRIGLLFYLGQIFGEMMSPASDYYAQVLIFMSVILWLDAEDEEFSYSMISILLVFAATIKFSIALLVLMVVYPAVILVKKRRVREIVVCIISGIVVLIPYFIRNILISGWLIYPSTFFDIANVDWKIPKGMAQYDAMEIGVYGKGINDVTKLDMPFSQWFPNWFIKMSVVEKFWVVMTTTCIAAGIIYFIYKLIKKDCDYNKLIVFLVLTASCTMWFITAPLVRYGYGYLTCIPLFVDGCLCMELIKKTGDEKSLYIAFLLIFAVIGIYRIKTVGYSIITTCKENYYVRQKDYVDFPAKEYNLDGHTIYIPESGDQIGYNQFPSSLLVIDVELRGEDFTDGFRFKDYDGFIESYNSGE